MTKLPLANIHPSAEEQQLLKQFACQLVAFGASPHWYRASLLLQLAQRLKTLNTRHQNLLSQAERIMLNCEI